MSACGHSQVNLFFRLCLQCWAFQPAVDPAYRPQSEQFPGQPLASVPASLLHPLPWASNTGWTKRALAVAASSDPPCSLPCFLPASAFIFPCTTSSCGNTVYLTRVNKEKYDPEPHAWHIFCHCSNDGSAEFDSETSVITSGLDAVISATVLLYSLF